MSDTERIQFPEWIDKLRPLVLGGLAIGPIYLIGLVTFGASPKTTNVGYAPAQPVSYSHELHVGELGLDCRYCHTTVEEAAMAAIPPTSTCMNCHAVIRQNSAALEPIRQSYATGLPVKWTKVHDLPDYAYFNHSVHVKSGVSCVSCHGRVDQMAVVTQVEPLSMGWCLKCHRDPAPNIRPTEEVTNLAWEPSEDPVEIGTAIMEHDNINPSTDCSTCHR